MLATSPGSNKLATTINSTAIKTGALTGLVSFSLPWQAGNFASLISHLPETPRLYWEGDRSDPAFLGWGQAARLTAHGEQRFKDIRWQAAQLFSRLVQVNPDVPDQVGPRLLGGFAFQPGLASVGLWNAFPDALFILPRVQLTHLDGHTWLTVNHWLTDTPLDAPSASHSLQAALARGIEEASTAQGAVRATAQAPIRKYPVTHSIKLNEALSPLEWQAMVEGAIQRIQNEEFKKVVLARTIQATLEESVPIGAILANLEQRYPDCFRFLIEPKPGQVFLGATPELLVEVSASCFHTTALAGTARRGHDETEDRELGQALLNSGKERLEHEIVVRAVEEKLTPLAETLQTSAGPTLRRLRNVQHLETKIQGCLATGNSLLDVVSALHPTPALGGWPAEPAQDYLRQAEPFERGWYAAPVGWMDPRGDGVFAGAIRSGLFTGNTAMLYAGAGIVVDSDPQREWQETRLKFQPILDAIRGARSYA